MAESTSACKRTLCWRCSSEMYIWICKHQEVTITLDLSSDRQVSDHLRTQSLPIIDTLPPTQPYCLLESLSMSLQGCIFLQTVTISQDWLLWPFRTCNALFQALLTFKVFTEKWAVMLVVSPLYVTWTFFLLQFIINFLSSAYRVS